MADDAKAASPVRIALSWAIVGIPLVYGIYTTVLRTAPLFTGG